MAADCRFDTEKHRYYINDRPVPSVTQVLADLLPGWRASDWYLQRGRAVHACAALVAQGKQFEHDERITGQVAACQKFFADLKPEVLGVEERFYSERYQFAGTADLIAMIQGRKTFVDYKASLTGSVPIQCAAYSLASGSTGPLWGLGVELHEDGSYKMSELYDLRRYTSEWLALLTAFNVRRRLKVQEESEDGTGEN